jgi:hypothetical protein
MGITAGPVKRRNKGRFSKAGTADHRAMTSKRGVMTTTNIPAVAGGFPRFHFNMHDTLEFPLFDKNIHPHNPATWR